MDRIETYSFPTRAVRGQEELITVAVTCYNIEPYIGRCLDSILRQTYRNLEILVIDDGSTDGSAALCDAYAAKDGRVRVVHQENGGPGRARNTAMEQAKGSYIAFVDGDDRIHPQMYEILLSCLKAQAADVAICKYLEVSEKERPHRKAAREEETGGEACFREGMVCTMDRDELLTCLVEEDGQYPIRNAVWNKLYRAELIGRLRMPQQMYYEDILFTMKLLAQAGRACFVGVPLYFYTTGRSGSIMSQGVNEGILTDQIPAYRAKDEYLISIGRQDLADTHDYLVYKKLLLLYTEARRSKDPAKRATRHALARQIQGCRERFASIYACRIADPHQKLRMRLFFLHPVLYNIFMDLNDYLILPMRTRK